MRAFLLFLSEVVVLFRHIVWVVSSIFAGVVQLAERRNDGSTARTEMGTAA